MNLQDKMEAALNKLCKWRTVFAGWQLGTRAKGDPESDAVRDHRELSMLMRAEVNATTALLIKKGLFTLGEFHEQLIEEAEHMDKGNEERFPGFKSTASGMTIDPEQARETMKGWRP